MHACKKEASQIAAAMLNLENRGKVEGADIKLVRSTEGGAT